MALTFETFCGALSKEIERCEELLDAYLQCGHAGVFASTVLSVELEKAHEALMMRDIAAMLKAYATLKECQ